MARSIVITPNGGGSAKATPLLTRETVFDSDPWREALEATFGLEIQTFVPTSRSDARAHYCVISDLRGPRVISLPFSDFCQPQLDAAGWAEFLSHLRSHGAPVTVRPFRGEHLVEDPSFERRLEHVWHAIDLSQGHEAIWDGLKSRVRTVVRRRTRYDITFRWTNSAEDLAAFHAMHVDLRKSKYRLLAQPFDFFLNLREAFGDSLALCLAEVDGDPVAGMVYIAWDGVWNYKFGASYPRPYRPNAALVVEACREGAERGLELLDLGRSDTGQSGLVRFKRQFATCERSLTTLHWQPEQPTAPAAEQANRTLSELTQLLTEADVPNEITARGGSLLYRHFG